MISKQKGVLLLVSMLLAATCLFGQTLQQARISLDNSNLLAARQTLIQLMDEKGSDKAEVAYYLGNSYMRDAWNDSAKIFYNIVIALSPESPVGYLSRGRISLIDSNKADARQNFDKALKLTQYKDANIFCEIEDAYLRPHVIDLNEAATSIEGAFKLDNKNASVLLKLGDVYAEKSDDDSILSVSAFSRYHEAFSLNNSFSITWLDRARILIHACDYVPLLRDRGVLPKLLGELGEETKPVSELKEISMLPDSTIREMFLDSSVVYLHRGIPQGFALNSWGWLMLGNALYKNHHDAEEVIPFYEKSRDLDARYYDAYFNLGIVYNEINEAEKAKENLHKAYDLKPNLVATRFLLAQTYAKLNQPEYVDYWLGKGLELKKQDAADYYLIGTAFGKVGHNLKKAIDFLKKAVDLNPKAELYYEDLGVAYGLSGDFDKAIATSKKLIQLNPTYAPAYLNLAISYQNKGNKKLADENRKKYNDLTRENR